MSCWALSLWFVRVGLELGLLRREADLQKSESQVLMAPFPGTAGPLPGTWSSGRYSREAPGSWDSRLVTPLAETLPF